MGKNKVEKAKKWLEDRVDAAYASRVDNLALAGLQIVGAQAGRILCNFLVPRHLADKDGNWRAGAIATLIDNVGSVAIASTTGSIKISVDFDISYFSTAKINEEVDIEAISSAHVGQLSYVTVEIRKKGSREMVAVGKQWMASTSRVQKREGKAMAQNKAEMAKKWLEDRANPAHSTIVGNLAIGGLQVVSAQTGRILCNFLLPKHLSDKDGNWRAGAIATLIDNVGSSAIASATGYIKISVAFDISYFSTAKINEEVEIEARTLAHVGKLSNVIVEIRKKESGEVVAVGKQWMASTSRGQR